MPRSGLVGEPPGCRQERHLAYAIEHAQPAARSKWASPRKPARPMGDRSAYHRGMSSFRIPVGRPLDSRTALRWNDEGRTTPSPRDRYAARAHEETVGRRRREPGAFCGPQKPVDERTDYRTVVRASARLPEWQLCSGLDLEHEFSKSRESTPRRPAGRPEDDALSREINYSIRMSANGSRVFMRSSGWIVDGSGGRPPLDSQQCRAAEQCRQRQSSAQCGSASRGKPWHVRVDRRQAQARCEKRGARTPHGMRVRRRKRPRLAVGRHPHEHRRQEMPTIAAPC